AQAGDVDGLRQVSEDLAHFWNDRLEGKLIPLPPIDPNNSVPWVHQINQLHSRHTSALDAKYGKQARYQSFVRAVKDWTDGRWRALRSAARKVLNGEHGGADHAKARELIEGIDSAPNSAPRRRCRRARSCPFATADGGGYWPWMAQPTPALQRSRSLSVDVGHGR